jgi:hypothetical protein
MRRGALAFAVLALAACSSAPTPPPPVPLAPPPPPPPPRPIAVVPPRISIPPPPTTPMDQCGAWELQGLVGRPRSAIPVPVEPQRRRVVCTTCPRTMDYNERRLTIEYDAVTNLVTRVACG